MIDRMKCNLFVWFKKYCFINVLTFILINSTASMACSCIPKYSNFKGGVKNTEVLVHVKVMGKFAHPKHIDGPNKKHIRYASVIKLEVLDNLNNNKLSKIIYFKNGASASCELSIFQFEIGDELLLKAFKSRNYIQSTLLSEYVNIYNTSKFLLFNNEIENDLVESGSCGYNLLTIENSIVRGNLTKNKTKWKLKYSQILGKLSKKWESNFLKKKISSKDNLQYMHVTALSANRCLISKFN